MKGKSTALVIFISILLLTMLGFSSAAGQEPEPDSDSAPSEYNGITRIEWQPQIAYDRVILTVTGPDDFFFQQVFEGREIPYFEAMSPDGNFLADGSYSYEVQFIPTLSETARTTLEAAENDANREEIHDQLVNQGLLPGEEETIQSGFLFVQDGAFIVGGDQEEAFSETADVYEPQEELEDQVILDDLIVDGSACIGVDCVNGESFGFDTLRLKENNLRIKFQDTSNSGSFPTNDWQITANDSNNGGANKFSIDDVDGGRTPFTLIAGAPTNSLYVDAQGDVGFGTSTPVTELHSVDGDTPTLRLEQNGSSGWTPQTWDVAGNETNFFIRDVTNGSRLPFKIRPSAPTNSIYIDTDGDVGLGTASPQAALDVDGSDGATMLIVDENNSTVLNRTLLTLENNGAPQFVFSNSDTGASWQFSMLSNNYFIISQIGTGGSEFSIDTSGQVTMGPGGASNFFLDASGNLSVAGTVTPGSSRDSKENLQLADTSDILDRVIDLSIYYYNYKNDDDSVVHVGPMAEDFAATFEVGADDKHIATLDIAGVALAAVQELHAMFEAKEAQILALETQIAAQQVQIDDLRTQNADLEARLAVLEAIILNQEQEPKK